MNISFFEVLIAYQALRHENTVVVLDDLNAYWAVL